MGFSSVKSNARAVLDKWAGPYYPTPATRRSLSAGAGYAVRMRMPNADAGSNIVSIGPRTPGAILTPST